MEKTENENDPVGSKVEDAAKGKGNWRSWFPRKGSLERLANQNFPIPWAFSFGWVLHLKFQLEVHLG